MLVVTIIYCVVRSFLVIKNANNNEIINHSNLQADEKEVKLDAINISTTMHRAAKATKQPLNDVSLDYITKLLDKYVDQLIDSLIN